jgi:hypothetical protein
VLEQPLKNSTWYQSSVPEEPLHKLLQHFFKLAVTFLLQLQKTTLTLFLFKLVLALSLGTLGLIFAQTGTT